MSFFADKYRRQNAVYWAPGEPNRFGERAFSPPIDIFVWWYDIAKQFNTPRGVVEISNAQVMADRALALGGFVLRGTLLDVVDLDDPKQNAGALEIRQKGQITEVSGHQSIYTAIV